MSHIFLHSFFRSFSVAFCEFTVNAKWYVGEVATLDGSLESGNRFRLDDVR